jgi:hypothetical protein
MDCKYFACITLSNSGGGGGGGNGTTENIHIWHCELASSSTNTEVQTFNMGNNIT